MHYDENKKTENKSLRDMMSQRDYLYPEASYVAVNITAEIDRKVE